MEITIFFLIKVCVKKKKKGISLSFVVQNQMAKRSESRSYAASSLQSPVREQVKM